MKITILGAGAWGTALANLLYQEKHLLTLWSNLPDHVEEMLKTRRNDRFLPGSVIPDGIEITGDINQASSAAECLVVAVPSKAVREVTRPLYKFAGIIVSVTKGIEYETGLTMSRVIKENVQNASVVALSGPSLAPEVARGIPTAVVAACNDIAVAEVVQKLFHRKTFRVYTSTDILGVELGGALKNVIAIAAGVCDGLGLGDNSKAALVTRGIAEIRRLGVACGARADTFAGLSGIGDLTVTCFSKLSRNRTLGERLGRGEKLDDILASMVAVAEGYPTAKSAWQLAQKKNVYTPIIAEVYRMLYEGKDVKRALTDLIDRESKAEDEFFQLSSKELP
jgi:glycerol-3-phosphate dehydrogenase (NAD(P)+)